MTTIHFTNTAGPFRIFSAGAFDDVVGKSYPIKFDGEEIGAGKIVAAQVNNTGTEVEFTVELDSEVNRRFVKRLVLDVK